MPCSTLKVGEIRAIVCGLKQRIRACAFCGRPSSLLCDFPKAKKSCDKPLCNRCAISTAPNVDMCPDHPVSPAQMSLGIER